MEQNTKISAGEVIVLTEGEYSNYRIGGYIVSRIDFDIKEASKEFLTAFSKKEGDWDYYPRERFIAWLISTEKAVPVAHREIHIGSYDDLEIS